MAGTAAAAGRAPAAELIDRGARGTSASASFGEQHALARRCNLRRACSLSCPMTTASAPQGPIEVYVCNAGRRRMHGEPQSCLQTASQSLLDAAAKRRQWACQRDQVQRALELNDD